jgi:solute:Na+ symporter, SSS family
LVPAAIMSIAAANLFTRNIYREYFAPHATPAQEARVSKLTSLVVKFGALIFVLVMDRQNAINLQLLGGVWILQTFLTIVAGLFTRWFHRWALFAGWAVAMVYGTVAAYQQTIPNTKVKLVNGAPVTQLHGTRHFGSSLAYFPLTGTKVYIAITAFVFNIIVAVVLTVVFRALNVDAGTDATSPEDYYSDSGDPGVKELALDVAEQTGPGSRPGQTGRSARST